LISAFIFFQPAADAKHYGHFEVYTLLRSRGAKLPVLYLHFSTVALALIRAGDSSHVYFLILCQKTKKTPMVVSNPKEVPEYELNPLELEFRRGEEVTKASFYKLLPFLFTVSFFMSAFSVRSVFPFAQLHIRLYDY
jgi:hypothetical protein